MSENFSAFVKCTETRVSCYLIYSVTGIDFNELFVYVLITELLKNIWIRIRVPRMDFLP